MFFLCFLWKVEIAAAPVCKFQLFILGRFSVSRKIKTFSRRWINALWSVHSRAFDLSHSTHIPFFATSYERNYSVKKTSHENTCVYKMVCESFWTFTDVLCVDNGPSNDVGHGCVPSRSSQVSIFNLNHFYLRRQASIGGKPFKPKHLRIPFLFTSANNSELPENRKILKDRRWKRFKLISMCL